MLKTLWVTSRWGITSLLFGYLIIELFIPDLKWNDQLFHVLLEGGGSIVAFILAVLVFVMIQTDRLTINYFWLALSFTSMGILDLSHSQTPPGQAFVWLHSIATFSGGVFASLIWFSGISLSFLQQKIMLLAVVIICIIFSVFSITFPDMTLNSCSKMVIT